MANQVAEDLFAGAIEGSVVELKITQQWNKSIWTKDFSGKELLHELVALDDRNLSNESISALIEAVFILYEDWEFVECDEIPEVKISVLKFNRDELPAYCWKDGEKTAESLDGDIVFEMFSGLEPYETLFLGGEKIGVEITYRGEELFNIKFA